MAITETVVTTGLQSLKHGIMKRPCQNVVEAHLLLLSIQEDQRLYTSRQTILSNVRDSLRNLRYIEVQRYIDSIIRAFYVNTQI